MRRNNLIIKGIPENGQEGYAESETIVKDFCSTHLKINVGDIERAHRIGQRRPGFHRPIIIKFLNFKTKTEVLRNAPKLKNLDFPKVWIEEDFSPKVQLARRKLREYARSNREGTEPFSIRYNSLHLKGSIYRYDPVKDNIVEVPTRNQSSRRGGLVAKMALTDTPTSKFTYKPKKVGWVREGRCDSSAVRASNALLDGRDVWLLCTRVLRPRLLRMMSFLMLNMSAPRRCLTGRGDDTCMKLSPRQS
ncbi:hypothetical protein HPB51_001617 [Rhipicephalus microplus]|uniref:Uncharacterized protein n=1 Tax=Rhipicephalus microplus TaxID=6941 RepID=A0A9J6DXU0_RHIMP|nr:hypothetical protein HPB51_001617 [Rhipicephalus microplus]